MARIFIAGHEHGDLSEWDYQFAAVVAAAQSGMDGNYCLDLRTANAFVAKYLGGNKTEIYGHFLVRRVSTSSYSHVLVHFFASDRADAGYMFLDSTSWRLTVGQSYGGTTLAQDTTTLALNTTYRVEFYFKPSTGSDGRWIVKLDGTTVIDYTGITSDKTSVAYMGLANVRKHAYVNHGEYFDNIIVDDAGWITLTGEQPHRISKLTPTAEGAEDDLSAATPPNLGNDVARWLFESADLGNDEKGNADLTLYNSPTADTNDKQEGGSSIKLVRTSSQYGKVLDSALPSGFPLKSEVNRVFTLTFWYKPDTLPANLVYHYIFNKGVSGDYSFYVATYNSKLCVGWGWAASSITRNDVVTLTADQWYFVAVVVNGDSKILRVIVYDAAAAVTTVYTFTTPSDVLRISSCDLYIGSDNTGGNTLDGWLDNMRLHPAILHDLEISLLRQGRTTFYKYEIADVTPAVEAMHFKGHTDADAQTFGMSNLVGSVESIKCVQVAVRNYLTGAPSAKMVSPIVRLSGTNYAGDAAQAPPWIHPKYNCKVWNVNPATSAAWLKSEVDGMECGVKLTTT